uniref:DRBM domain-containing protein n=1 Tax=Alexandrium catenella TaxID=2925 RepID=A0A7S1WLG1_ALECA
MDPKTELNQFCQRFCQRPVTKSDIVYVTSKFGHQFGYQFQAIVKLNCLQGEEYAGNLSPSPKEAEKSAAQQALAAYANHIAAAPLSASKDPLTAPAPRGAAREAKQPEEDENPAITPKTKLNSLCMRIAKRYLQKGETVYECRKVPGGYQATVKLSALPGEWKDRLWAGQVFTTKQKAEQSAAEIALMQISEDQDLSEEAAKPKGTGKGKGKGKGKGFGKGGGKSWGWDWGCGWTWQSDATGPDQPRERVTEERISGEVLDWKETYGWVKPCGDIDHPAAQLRNGKVYLHQKDLVGELKALEAGARVTFHVYEDPSGLGAEEVEMD